MNLYKPVAFASRSLTAAETRFSQIEKEFLAVVYACQKFHNYIYGHHVVIHTDHKPIEAIMKKGVAEVQSPRLQRMKVKLLKYDVIVQYKPGKEMLIADLLSRNYIKESGSDQNFLTDIVHSINLSNERQIEFKVETSKDEELKLLMDICIKGWPSSITQVPDLIKKYFAKRNNIYILNDLIFLDERVIVPKSLRNKILEQLHENHYGVIKTQQRARQILY